MSAKERDPLVELEGVSKHFPVKQGVFARGLARVARGRERDPDGAKGGDAGHCRRVGVRQVDDCSPHPASARSDLRDDPFRRGRHHPALATGDAAVAAPDADDLPGPVRLPQPPEDGGADRRGAVCDPPHREPGRGGPARQGAARGRRPQPRAREPLRTRVLRRPAAADRGRPRARAQPAVDRVRRACLGARRLGAGADPQPAPPAPAGVRPHVRVHLARPVGDAADLRPDRRHVRRAHRRARGHRAHLREPEAPLYGGARCPPCPACPPMGPASGSSSAATCPPRSPHHRPVCSIRAAHACTWGTATWRSRCSSRSRSTRATWPAVTIRSNAGR